MLVLVLRSVNSLENCMRKCLNSQALGHVSLLPHSLSKRVLKSIWTITSPSFSLSKRAWIATYPFSVKVEIFSLLHVHLQVVIQSRDLEPFCNLIARSRPSTVCMSDHFLATEASNFLSGLERHFHRMATSWALCLHFRRSMCYLGAMLMMAWGPLCVALTICLWHLSTVLGLLATVDSFHHSFGTV